MRKEMFVKLILCFLLVIISFEWAYGGGENSILYTQDSITVPSTMFYLVSEPKSSAEIAISYDGTITIGGKSIEKMNHPEIKEIMSKILVEMQKSNREIFRQCEQQTDYLLKELGFVRELLRQCEGKR